MRILKVSDVFSEFAKTAHTHEETARGKTVLRFAISKGRSMLSVEYPGEIDDVVEWREAGPYTLTKAFSECSAYSENAFVADLGMEVF